MSLRKFSLTVKRYNDSSYDDTTGKVIEGRETDIEIKASVQAVKGSELNSNPSLRSETKTYRVYTRTKLFTAEQDGFQADKIEIYGEEYEIVQVEEWQNGLINHYKAYAQRC